MTKMSTNSAQIQLFLIFLTLILINIIVGVHSLHIVSTLIVDSNKINNAQSTSFASSSSSLRHKIAGASKVPNNNKPPSPPQQVEEDDVTFCTLANFQNCISELWPGGAGAATGAPTTPQPTTSSTASSSSRKKHGDYSSEDISDATATTTSAPVSSGDLAFPTSYRELQATCSDLKERVRCLDRHSERCFTPEMMQVFGHIVANAKHFVHDLCDNKRVQSEFLIHAKCFRNISLDEQKCAHEYRDAINIPVSESKDSKGPRHTRQIHQQEQLSFSPYEMLPSAVKLISSTGQQQQQQTQEFQIKELIMRRSCCALQELVNCKRRNVRAQCGESAAIFMRDHLPRITNPILEQHCNAYTHGANTCDEALYRGRIVDGQLMVAQSPHYHNPFDRGSSAGMGSSSSSQHLGNNRITRNQGGDTDSSCTRVNAIPFWSGLLLPLLTSICVSIITKVNL